MPPTNINLSPGALAEINKRVRQNDSRSALVSAALERYFEALRRARMQLRVTFSEKEMCLIAESSNGNTYEPAASIQLLDGGIADSIAMGRLDSKWGVAGEPLLKKLGELSFIEKAAVVDTVERYWNWRPTQENEERPNIMAFLE